MNCANHPGRERAAFCQNCGKPLCTECMRTLGSSIYCEPCYAIRTAPGYTASAAGVPVSGHEPNPGLAAILGFIPGVGAMYNEQYAKGLVHLVIFAFLVTLSHDVHLFGLFVAGWIVYMVIEAYHTARARRDGTPLPNPFGLNDIGERLGMGRAWPPTAAPGAPFSSSSGPAGAPGTQPGAPPDPAVPPANPYTPPYSYTYVPPVSSWGVPPDPTAYPYTQTPPVNPMPPVAPVPDPSLTCSRRFPAAAVWLIGLGVFFLLANIGVIHGFPARIFFPFLLIGIGVWVFVRRMTCSGHMLENDGTPDYHRRLARAVNSSIWLILTGILWLLDEFDIISWGRSWPLWLIAVGVLLFFKRTAYAGYPPYTGPYPGQYPGQYPNQYPGQYPAGYPYTPPPAPPTAPSTSTGLVPTTHPDDTEGR